MAKVRIYDLAKELSLSPKELLDMLSSIGVANKVASSSVEPTAAASVRQLVANKNGGADTTASTSQAPAAPTPQPAAPQPPRVASRPPFGDGGPRPANSNGNNNGGNGNAPYRGGQPSQGGPRPDNRGSDNRGGGTGYQGQRPQGQGGAGAPTGGAPRPAGTGYQGNNAGGGGNRPSGPGGGNRGPGGGNRGPNNRGPRPAPATGPDAPKPQNLEASPFAVGGRDRRNAKRGRYRGHERGGRGGRGAAEEIIEEVPLTEADMKIEVSGDITVADLAKHTRKTVTELIRALMSMGVIRAANQPLEIDIATQLVAKFGFTIERESARAEENVTTEENPDELVTVPPVVVVMGHVDHGKTSLLDRIRGGKVQQGEAGGITQRIGAYETEHNGHRIVFLDTPGHEAFTRMRARGAHITDIAILVVAADDGVMPQTREAIDHARAAKLPIIVAMNKMDKADADPMHVKAQLAEVGLVPEEFGGDTVVIPVSAKTGAGVSELLDMVLLVTEIQDLKANPTGLATGTVIEARQDANLGPVATVLLHRGTLHVGDHIIIGDSYGRVRSMLDYRGEPLQEAGPKTPVFITGLSIVPHASDSLRAAPSAREAREAAELFSEERRTAYGQATTRSLADVYAAIKTGAVKELNLIVKADGQGSVEALSASLEKLAHEEVRVKIVSRGVGNVTENDVNLASATDAFIIAFSVALEGAARSLADREKVDVRIYDVIYDAIDEVKQALEGMLKPIFEEKYMGEAEVRALFKSTKAGAIAGCLVLEGKMVQGGILRVERNKKQIYEGKLDSLRHIKAEVKEMVAGQECGISTKNFNNFIEGDRLKCFILEQVKRSLDS